MWLCHESWLILDMLKLHPLYKRIKKAKELLKTQGQDGTWNYDPYMQGMYNGMEVVLATLENRQGVFRSAPDNWLSNNEKPSTLNKVK